MEINPGGPPRNAWTPSRRRKLVRLYTLTSLDKNEIVNVLRDHDFNPSSSDVQKKLRELLPRDYAKEWKSFRPAKDQPISARLDKIRRRPRRKGDASSLPKVISNIPNPSPPLDELFEGPRSAFRNYLSPNDVVSPDDGSTTLEQEPISRIIDPSRLLLDGSLTPLPCSEASPNAFPCRDGPNEQSHLDSTSSLRIQTADVAVPRPRGSLPSIRSLKQRIKQSEFVVQSIHSVLRFSSTDSWRSSLSIRSSIVSVESLRCVQMAASSMIGNRPPSPTGESGSTVDAPERKRSFRRRLEVFWANRRLPVFLLSTLTKRDEQVWNQLIKRDVPLGPFDARPEFQGMSLQFRPCCREPMTRAGSSRTECEFCGIREEHVLARSSQLPLPFHFYSSRNNHDYFDNGVLHFAAVSPHWTANTFIAWINADVDIKLVNTIGQNFLHVLFANLVSEQLSECFDLVSHKWCYGGVD